MQGDTTNIVKSTNQYIDGLLVGNKWNLTVINYYYPQSVDTDSANMMDRSSVVFDGGYRVDTSYITSGANAGSSTSDFKDAAGKLDYSQTVNSDQSIDIVDLDQTGAFSWKEIHTRYDSLGREANSVIINDDKTSSETLYDISGAKAWVTIVTNTDAQNRIESIVTTYDDGSFALESYTYNGGNLSSIKHTAFNSDGLLLP
jgi:hypothetical protein